MLRLAIYTGARINEIAQLRKRDVRRYTDGQYDFPYIHIREGHPEQSVKGKKGEDNSRKVPLHPALYDAEQPGFVGNFVTYADASETDFIFGAFEWHRESGRAAWLITTSPRSCARTVASRAARMASPLTRTASLSTAMARS
ncbi:MAG: hypothetical protein AB7O44_28590 [Hyphomicrobiaceae bacterium]